MMKVLILLAALAATTLSSHFHPQECGVLQKLMVKQQWVEAHEFGEQREGMDQEIWEYLFDKHPTWRENFKDHRSNNLMSPEFRAFAARLDADFDMIVNLLLSEEELQAQIDHLAHKFKDQNLPDGFIDEFDDAVIHVSHHHIGHCFDWDAWDVCTKLIETGIHAAMSA